MGVFWVRTNASYTNGKSVKLERATEDTIIYFSMNSLSH